MWELLTGTVAPLTPISPSTYTQSKIPWFDLYNEGPATKQAGFFQNVQSLAEVDAIVSSKILSGGGATKSVHDDPLDPRKPPDCSTCELKKGACVFRPCCHVACHECLRKTIDDKSKCSICGVKVERFVGFLKKVELKKLEEIEKEKLIEGVEVGDQSAWTIHLDADRVAKLQRGVGV